jgi:hypothetical protein
MAKEAGEIVRYEPAPEPMAGAVAIGVLTLLNVACIVAFAASILGLLPPPTNMKALKAADPGRWAEIVTTTQQLEGFLLATSLTITAFILAIYRRWFLPDILVVKRRRKKFEDL